MGRDDQHREPEPQETPLTTASGETLQVGPARPSVWQRLPVPWRQAAVVLLALALGVVVGVVVTSTSREEPAAPAPRAPVRTHEHDVELVLFGAVLPGRRSTSDGTVRPLRLRAALLLSGNQSSEVLAVDSLDGSLVVRAAGLPVTVTPAARFRAVVLEVVPRDCTAARTWPPDARPFTLTWRDQEGLEHTDRAGDHGKSTARAVRRHLEAVCR